MSIAEKLTLIAENEKRVYDAGYAKGKAEGSADSMIGTYIIYEEPSVAGEPMFGVNVVGKGHYSDGENFVEHDLCSIALTWSQSDFDGYVIFRVGEVVTAYHTGGSWQSDGDAFYIGGGTDTTLLRTITLTEEPTDENLRAWLKKNATFIPAEHPVVDPDKIIEATTTGIDSVYINDVSEVKHNIKIETTAGAKVKVRGKNLFDCYGYSIEAPATPDVTLVQESDKYAVTIDTTSKDAEMVTVNAEVGNSELPTSYLNGFVYCCFYNDLKDGDIVTISFDLNVSENPLSQTSVAVYTPSGSNVLSTSFTGNGGRVSATLPWKTNGERKFFEIRTHGMTTTISNIQVELGRVASEYGAFRMVEYTADPNGIVIADSMSPVMNIVSNGGEIAVEYNESWGMNYEHDTFWDTLQNGGLPSNYAATFGAAWTEETFRPKYDLVPTNAYMMFRQNQMNIDLVEYLEKLGIALDTSQCENFSYMFSSSKFTRIGVIDLSGSTQTLPGDSLFTNCRNLVTIDKIILKTGTRGEFSSGCFNTCSSLENLNLEGALTGTIDLQWSTKLSKDSIENVQMAANLGHQISPNAPVMIISKNAVNKAFETSEGAYDGVDSDDWNNLVNNSSWTITLI